jgi:hypothetical protein
VAQEAPRGAVVDDEHLTVVCAAAPPTQMQRRRAHNHSTTSYLAFLPLPERLHPRRPRPGDRTLAPLLRQTCPGHVPATAPPAAALRPCALNKWTATPRPRASQAAHRPWLPLPACWAPGAGRNLAAASLAEPSSVATTATARLTRGPLLRNSEKQKQETGMGSYYRPPTWCLCTIRHSAFRSAEHALLSTWRRV